MTSCAAGAHDVRTLGHMALYSLCCLQQVMSPQGQSMFILCDTFLKGHSQVDLMNTKMIMESAAGQEVLERGIPMVGESGIFTAEHVTLVQDAGCEAILVSESIVKQGDRKRVVTELLS
jgi:uncharacterized protein (UPF0264 family)